MAPTLLNLQRVIRDFSQNTFIGMTVNFGQAEATISARSNGTFERFIMRIVPSGAPNFPSGNESNSLVTLDLLINNVVQPNSKIQITGIGQTGTFLPISQLPVGFLKDDDIVVRLTGMSPIPPAPFPFVRMEIDYDLKFDVDPDVIVPTKGYLIGNQSRTSSGKTFRSLGGSISSSFVETSNTVPAMGSGTFKRLRTNIFIDTGDNLDIETRVNGVSSGFLGVPLNGVGVKTTDLLNRAFVKDDLLSIGVTKGGASGNIQFNTWLELTYEATEFWFYSPLAGAGFGSNNFFSIIGNSVNRQPSTDITARTAQQRSIGRSGIIKDLAYYGTAPAGTGTTVFTLEVNGIDVFNTGDIPVHGGFAIDRFDNINIVVGANDLINIKTIGRDAVTTGIFGIRFIPT